MKSKLEKVVSTSDEADTLVDEPIDDTDSLGDENTEEQDDSSQNEEDYLYADSPNAFQPTKLFKSLLMTHVQSILPKVVSNEEFNYLMDICEKLIVAYLRKHPGVYSQTDFSNRDSILLLLSTIDKQSTIFSTLLDLYNDDEYGDSFETQVDDDTIAECIENIIIDQLLSKIDQPENLETEDFYTLLRGLTNDILQGFKQYLSNNAQELEDKDLSDREFLYDTLYSYFTDSTFIEPNTGNAYGKLILILQNYICEEVASRVASGFLVRRAAEGSDAQKKSFAELLGEIRDRIGDYERPVILCESSPESKYELILRNPNVYTYKNDDSLIYPLATIKASSSLLDFTSIGDSHVKILIDNLLQLGGALEFLQEHPWTFASTCETNIKIASTGLIYFPGTGEKLIIGYRATDR